MFPQKIKKYILASVFVLAFTLLSACASSTPSAVPTLVPTSPLLPTVAPTTAAYPTAAPTEAPSATPSTSTETYTVMVAHSSSLGDYLVDSNGFTLYHYLNDGANQDNCTGVCAEIWPPYTITGQPTAGPGVTGTLGTITLSDGSTMVTYNQEPLHLYSGDTAAGQTNGQDFANLWYVIAP
jgi:predicted lipoprotein with Yx(FWY)xxD motif